MTTPEKQLKKMRRDSTSDHTFKKELWSDLSLAFDHEYPAMRLSWRKMIAVPVAAITLFVTMGTGVYAYSSPQVHEQSALYPVKRGIESLEAKFRRSPQAQAVFHARMAERRIQEGEVMLHQGVISKDQLLEIASELGYTIEDFNEAKQNPELMDEIKQDLQDEIIERFQTQISRYQHLIDRTREYQENHDEIPLNGDLRNKIYDIRVHINESDLTEDQKELLIDGLRQELDSNHNE